MATRIEYVTSRDTNSLSTTSTQGNMFLMHQWTVVHQNVTVIVIYYLWSTTTITTLLSSFVRQCLVILPSWVTWMTDTRYLLGLWLHLANQDDCSGLPQMLHEQLNESSSTCLELSAMPRPLVVVGGRQGPMHSHSHSMTMSSWSHPGHTLSHTA